MQEKIFVMIKPRHFHLAEDILNELDKHGTKVKLARVEKVPRSVISEHYSMHKEKPFFNDVVNTYIGNSVLIAVYEGRDIIKIFSDLIGKTDPKEAENHIIRHRYGFVDSKDIDERKIHNVIHRSDSIESAEREILVWIEFLNL